MKKTDHISQRTKSGKKVPTVNTSTPQTSKKGFNAKNVAPPSERLLLAVSLHQSGKLDEASVIYRSLIPVKPDNSHALHYLGLIALQKNSFKDAVSLIRRAIKLENQVPAFHFNLGNAYRGAGRFDMAASAFQEAVRLDPLFHPAYSNLGYVLHNLGKLSDAEFNFRNAVALNADITRTHSGLGRVLQAQGKFGEAVVSYQRALKLEDSAENKIGFAQSIKNVVFAHDVADIRLLLNRAISESWGRPYDLMAPTLSLIKLNKDIQECIERAVNAWPRRLSAKELYSNSNLTAVSGDLLLKSLLENTSICDLDLERFLTVARFAMLDEALVDDVGIDKEESNLPFYCALAQQCFINEYVFDCQDEEYDRAGMLRDQVSASIKSGSPIAALKLVAVAAYFPLTSLSLIESLLEQSWSDSVDALLTQQVREPMEELQLRSSIPCLTTVDAGVSSLVKQQYEENPYPRWKRSPLEIGKVSIDTFLRQQLPHASFKPIGKINQVDVLIAGCGTGQQSTEAAKQFLGANILAIDLSLTSLSYAKRKTRELGLNNIEYAQADIMKLGEINRSFDVIESVGVLHHMENPMAGWKILLSLLRPGGVMWLGFYSELARKDVVVARELIAERGYDSSAKDIRRCRQEIMSQENRNQFSRIITSNDFYGTSTCRDLIFHVQEQRYTLPQLKESMKELGVKFIGFSIESFAMEQYGKRFPEDKSKKNLDKWDIFENENPHIFAGMYQFLVQKPK
ncbi:MAG: tetratricopeptide repeat protein [Gallionella sp.]